jgi:DNA-binding IclR family transcriptional regulator
MHSELDSTAVSQSSPRRIVEVHRRRLGWDQSGSQTLAKGLTLLELVAERQGGYGVGLVELARELGWNKSTTHRLLATLVSLGYAQQDPESGWYRIGLKAFQLGAAYPRDLDLRREAAPSLIDLHDPLRMHAPIGARFPWNSTAAGKAIMAFVPEIEAKPLLTGKLPRRTSTSVHVAETLRAQFVRVRANGYATDNEENADAVRCVAAPVFDSAGRAIAAIRISGHSGQIAVNGFRSWGWLSGTLRTECHDGLAVKDCEIPSGGVRSWIDSVV